MSISTQEVFEALLLDVLHAYDITPKFTNQPGAKALGRMHLSSTIAKMLVEIEDGKIPTAEGAKIRISDEWNRLVSQREAEVRDAVANEMERLKQFEANLQEQIRQAQKPQQGGVWQRYEDPKAASQ